jgi:dsDNA-specific endonuclease/ATPase MutS2
MKLRKGDKVKFLNEAGGGTVVNVIDNNQVLVQIEDGFEIPVPISQLILSNDSRETDNHKEEKELKLNQIVGESSIKKVEENYHKKHSDKIIEISNTFFAFVAVKNNDGSIKFNLYLLNDGLYDLEYIVAYEKNDKLRLIEKGNLEPETKVNLGSFTFEELLFNQAIIIDIVMYSTIEYKMQLPVHSRINLKSLNLQIKSNFIENDYFEVPAYILNLLNSKIDNNIKINELTYSSKDHLLIKQGESESKHIAKDIEEVDLHIEELVDNISLLSNVEIIRIQMDKFNSSLEKALAGKTKKVVFIHGVGNGKLRYELRKTLDSKYPDLLYQDASYAEYGYGATMVIIRK